MTMNIVITVCYSLISVLLSSAASADVKWKLNSRPELIKEAHHLLKEASQLPDQTGLRRPLYRVNIDVGDKTVTKRVSYIWYYPDTAAVQSYATESVEYNELVEDLTIYEVVVINPKGTLTKFDKKNVQYGDSDRFNIFTHNKNVIFPLPGVEPGSFAVIDYEVKIDKSKLESSWSEIVYTENLYPIDHFDLTVSWLPTNTLNWSQSRDTVICREDTSRLQCSATEIKAAKRDRSVSWSDELGQIVVTEFTNWNQLVEQAFSAFSTAVKNDEKLNPLLEKITNKQEDLAGKIASIHRYVAQDIRYVSISKNGHSITPHSVLQTTKNKYGDCKDKSAVLVSMLKKVGVDAYPVLVATTRNRPDRLVVPAMRYFDHMVVCFQIDGEKYCLDATDSTTDWKTISSWIQGKASLRLLDKEQPQALPSSEFRWKMEIETRLKIDEKGYLQESQVRNYKKEYGSFIRSQLTGINDEEKVKWARDNYKAVVS
ncbi:MAG: DUF3857 domain-containing transglutaminase family protein, partial [Gammaproteobacteria bacterium]|nr:DUF3857 domain-containing transglutaminase family protein [Gammaproteobacteria bacterium]